MTYTLKTYIGPESDWDPVYVLAAPDGHLFTQMQADGAYLMKFSTMYAVVQFLQSRGDSCTTTELLRWSSQRHAT